MAVVFGGLLAFVLTRGSRTASLHWTPKERRVIEQLSLASLPPVPLDRSNRVADDPQAVELGRALFFDKGLSSNGRVSCATCHLPERRFQDARPVGKALALTDRRTMPLSGVAYATWLFWDGRRDSLWAQAVTPLESPVEHGITRTFAAKRIATRYRRAYEAVFGGLPQELTHALPKQAGPLGTAGERGVWRGLTARQRRAIDEMFANLGKAIAAYERRLLPGPGPFDRFAGALARESEEAANRLFDAAEARGLRLFIGPGHCTNCHLGPLFTNGEFHNTGVPQKGPALDRGRASGVRLVVADPFNCLGPFSDARPEDCSALRFIVTRNPRLSGAFKVPSLRDVGARAPYMHRGQFATLREVLEHYRRAPVARVGVTELKPLALSDRQLRDLEAFLRTLDGGLSTPKRLLRAPGRR